MGGEKFKDLEHVLHTSYRVLLTQDVYMERAAGKMREAEHGECLNGVWTDVWLGRENKYYGHIGGK